MDWEEVIGELKMGRVEEEGKEEEGVLGKEEMRKNIV